MYLQQQILRNICRDEATFVKVTYANLHMFVTHRLKQPEEDGEQEPPGQDVGVVGGGLNSAMLYDLLLGYGYGVEGGVSPGVDGVTLLGGEDGQSETGIETDLGGAKGGKSPTLTLTTCYSPVSSSVQSGGRGTNETGTATNFFDGSNFPPYSVILAITIAVGELIFKI